MEHIVFRNGGNRHPDNVRIGDENIDAVSDGKPERLCKLFCDYRAVLRQGESLARVGVPEPEIVREHIGVFGNHDVGFKALAGVCAAGIRGFHIIEG